MTEQQPGSWQAREVGRRVVYYRTREGLTQAALAQAIGVSERTIQRWETGRVTEMRHYLMLERLMVALDVSANELFGVTRPDRIDDLYDLTDQVSVEQGRLGRLLRAVIRMLRPSKPT